MKTVEVGDVVIIVEEKIRNGWIRGRVVEVIVGRDGRVRDAVIQTVNGIVHRPVIKLARLDIAGSKAGHEVPDQPYGSGKCCDVRRSICADSLDPMVEYPLTEDNA